MRGENMSEFILGGPYPSISQKVNSIQKMKKHISSKWKKLFCRVATSPHPPNKFPSKKNKKKTIHNNPIVTSPWKLQLKKTIKNTTVSIEKIILVRHHPVAPHKMNPWQIRRFNRVKARVNYFGGCFGVKMAQNATTIGGGRKEKHDFLIKGPRRETTELIWGAGASWSHPSFKSKIICLVMTFYLKVWNAMK